MQKANKDGEGTFRDELKEYRGNYFVTYQPADSRWNIATVSLVFHGSEPDPSEIKRLMGKELEAWLTRFRVPTMVSSFNATDSPIHLSTERGASHLMGYTDPTSAEFVRRWTLLKDEEMPAVQMTEQYFADVYRGLPFRFQKDIREAAEHEHRKLRTGFRIIRAFIIFVAVIPVAIELISLGVAWIGYILQAVSILVGLYKVAKTCGWIKESKAKKEEVEKQRKMAHYFYHCERNREGFERLKIENFRRETVEQTRREAEAIAARAAGNDAPTQPPILT